MAGFVLIAGAQAVGTDDTSASDDRTSVSDGYTLLQLGGTWVKWGDPTLGARAQVSYALADARMDYPRARNCRSIKPFDSLLGQSAITMESLRQEVAAAFKEWSEVANISFKEVKDPAVANIVIGAQVRPRGRAYSNVEYASGDNRGTRSISKSLICLNPTKDWKIGFDGDLEVYDLRYTLLHEIGHAIGLDHPGPHGQVMSFNYHENFRGLQAGDMNGANVLYGARGAPAGNVQNVARDEGNRAGGGTAGARVPQLSLGND